MIESADWWGAMNEQMRKYAGARNLPTKIADENDISETNATATLASSAILQPTSKPFSADIPKRPAVVPPSTGANTSKPGSLPSRSPQPQRQNQPMQPSVKSITVSASLAPTIPDYSAAEVSPEKATISQLSLAEQMELKLQVKSSKVSSPNLIDIPQFDAVPIPDSEKQPRISSNPWDTFEGDNNPGW
jgi:hypothetical protein